MKLLATAEIHESETYKDIVLRVKTVRGSIPVIIVNEGEVFTAEQIGAQVLECFNYFVQSNLIPQEAT